MASLEGLPDSRQSLVGADYIVVRYSHPARELKQGGLERRYGAASALRARPCA